MRRLFTILGCSLAAGALSACGGSGMGATPAQAPAQTNGAVSSLSSSTLPASSILSREHKRGSEFNESGNIVIADQFNNRVIEIDPPSHRIVWQFGNGASVPGPHSVVGPNDAERVGSFTLISGTGAPSGTEPSCGGQSGCPDNRVILVNASGAIVWQYDNVNTPVCSVLLPNGHVLITDQGNQRIIEVNHEKEIVWQYGTTGVSGSGANQLNNPNSAELLPDGNVLIADENNNRVIEIERSSKSIVWQYPSAPDTTLLNGAAFASRLPSGNTLITDSNNNRVIEVDPGKTVVWSYVTNQRAGSNANPLPTRAIRLRGGNTLISDQFNDQVIEVDHRMPAHVTVVQGGAINVVGSGFNQLNGPYDAKVIGDFTGLTPPPNDLDDGMSFLR